MGKTTFAAYTEEEIINMHEEGLIVIAYALGLQAEPPSAFTRHCAKARRLKTPGFDEVASGHKYESRETCNTLIELISTFMAIAQKIRLANALFIAVEGDGSTDVGKSHK